MRKIDGLRGNIASWTGRRFSARAPGGLPSSTIEKSEKAIHFDESYNNNYYCKFSNRVANCDALSCADASRPTSWPPAFVSLSWPLFQKPRTSEF